MYKAAHEFQNYMTRSNAFVDRLLAGGNRIDTGLVYNETDADLMQDSFDILLQVRVGLLDRLEVDREERSESRRLSQGKPSAQMSKENRQKLVSFNAKYRETLGRLNMIEAYMNMMEGRLASLGCHVERTNARRGVPKRK